MVKHRERHGRGLRGPLARPNPITGAPMPLRQRPRDEQYFMICVSEAVARIQDSCPRALIGIDVGVEDVPATEAAWNSGRVPLAAAMAAAAGTHGQIVVYRRPLEHRANSRKGLRILVFRTVVEQLSAMTGIPVAELDPEELSGDGKEDWD